MVLVCAGNTVYATEVWKATAELGLPRVRAFPASPPTGSGLGVHEKSWGGAARTADAHWPKGYPIHCHVHGAKLGKGEVGACWERWSFSSQVTFTWDGTLFSWGWLNSCLPMGTGKWMPSLALLVCVAFVLPVTLPSSQSKSYFTLTLLILSPISLSEKQCGE